MELSLLALPGLIESIKLFLPAAAYNFIVYIYFTTVLQSKLPIPLDNNTEIAGKRIVGDGRSFDGLFIALITGVVIGHLTGDTLAGLYIAVGANFGTVVNSIIKRRLNYPRGKKWIFDHIDFILGASLIYLSKFDLSFSVFLIGLILYGTIHWLANLSFRPFWESLFNNKNQT